MNQGLARQFLSLDETGRLALLRQSDQPILSLVRNQVEALLNSTLLYRATWREVANDDRLADFTHPGSRLDVVMGEVMAGHPDESFCFLDEGKLRARMRLLRRHFLPGNKARKISYALKANPKSRIVQILEEEGVDGFDCASFQEVEYVLGERPKAEVYLNNPIVPASHLEKAFEKGVRYFTAQSRGEIDRILKAASQIRKPKPYSVSVRLSTPNLDAKINLSEKFGASMDDATELLRLLGGESGIRRGLAIHTGSQNRSPETYRKGIELMAEAARRGGRVSSLNVGGGIPVNYHPDDHFEITSFLATISRSIEESAKGVLVDGEGSERQVILELGRAIVAEAVDLAIPILSCEMREGEKCLYINDGVFTSFSDAVIHHWPYSFDVIRRSGQPAGEGKEPYRVHGRTCDSGDTLGVIQLPEGLETGDWLWVRNAGAYLDSQTTYFNGFEPPTYVSYNVDSNSH